ncbi:MAG TPA: efflux RND transporter permease subunit [Candidatus Sulfotelmatobacter sp.]|nr:efflux RND transporter permease subunit [Candidatus Sulfotelmatobacter sp.]
MNSPKTGPSIPQGATVGNSGQHWIAQHSRPVIFLILTLALLGAYLAFTIPVSVFPSTDFPRVLIGVDNGVMPIDQMTVTVTRPIEEAVNSVPGLLTVRSTTSRGSAEIDLFFRWDVDMFQTLQYVNAAISRVQPELPSTAKIEAHRLTFAAFPIIGYSLTSATMPQTKLWEMATYEMKPRLNRLEGVSTVIVQGGQEPEFHITPDPAKLLTAGITITDILEAVRRTNLVDSPGLLERNHQLYLGLVNGQIKTPAEIANAVIKNTPAGIPVRIGDVSTVAPGVKPVYTVVTANGKPAVLLNINRQPDGNTMQVAQEVHDEIERIRQTLPPGVHIEPFYDQSIIVGDSIRSVRDAILLGVILASIILVVFLRDWGTSLVAGLVIPVTVLITFIALKVMGQTFNLMTLGGLAAAVGLVIDDAIVVVENIVLHRDAGQGRIEAIQSALKEITVPLIGSTITPIVVFLPLIAITGVTGVFFRALAVTMTVSLLTSLALALTWTPTLSQYFIKGRHEKKGATPATAASPTPTPTEVPEEAANAVELLAAEESHLSGFFLRVVNFYEHWLRRALERPRMLALFSAGLIVVSYVCYNYSGSDLLPEMDEGGFVLDYLMPAGSSLAETNRVVSHIEEMLRETPEVESTSRRTGLQLGLAAVTEANYGDVLVKLKAKRDRDIDEIMADLRAQIAQQEPAVEVEFTQVLQDMIGDLTSAPEPIQIKLFSQDAKQLEEWAPRVAEAIHKIDGVVDLRNGIENTISGPAITFQVDPSVAARAGFTAEEIAVDASAILEGEPASTPVVTNDRAYTLRVRFPAASRASLEAMRDTLLISSTGHTATLGALSSVVENPGQTEIRRENLQRDVAVTARLEGRSLGSGMADVQKVVAGLNIPSSIRVEYGGTYQEQQRSFHDLMIVLILAVLLLFIVLLFEFGTFAAPVAILSSALLSTSGVFIALLITRTTFNISSFMGMIMVIGIVAKNGILLLDADQKMRTLGLPTEDAMLQAGRRRLRPIVMTALATVAGMLPLAFAIGAGSQMLQPLAIAVIGGVLISMVLSLIITPAVHFYLSGKAASPEGNLSPAEE